MSAQYDKLASEYRVMIDNYLPNYVEDYTFSSILGDVSGKSVIDVGCGTGASTRLIKQLGAARVVGMDISAEMLKEAQGEEQQRPLGIEYIQGDMFAPANLGSFDLVSAFGSLTSSPTRDHLLKTAEMIFNNLSADGRLVASFYEPQPPQVSQRLEKYGVTFSMPEPLREGDVFHMMIRTAGQPLTFQDYFYPRTTYEWAFRTAGFQTIHWHRPMVSPEGLQKFGQEFWQDWVENQVCIYLECIKTSDSSVAKVQQDSIPTESEQRRARVRRVVSESLASIEPKIKVPPEGWNRRFIDLGYDSIALLDVQIAISTRLGIDLPTTLFFSYQTPEALVEAILPLAPTESAKPAAHAEPKVPFQVVDFYETRNTPSFHELSRFHLRVTKQVNRQVEIDGKPFIDFASCNYLGLDYHPDVMNAIPKMVAEWGVHPSWTRLVASPEPYVALEERLAEFIKVSKVVVFPSISSLNFAALPLLAGPSGVILCDIATHHTVQEACLLAQAKGITCVQYKHNDLNDLEYVLKYYPNRSPIIITVDGVYSMSAEYENLAAYRELLRRYNAYLYVDDAHGLGVVGENPSPENPYGHKGNGIVNYYGLDCAAEHIIYVSGLSKAFSSYAAFISCPDAETQEKLQLSSTYVFSGPVPVASLASALAGLEVNAREGDQLRATLYRLSHRLATGARALGFEVDNTGGFPIIFVVTGGYERTVQAINLAWEYGLLITPGIFPIVPYHRGGLRFSLTALNTDEEIETTLQALKEIRQRISD